jgi:hypothetical protein
MVESGMPATPEYLILHWQVYSLVQDVEPTIAISAAEKNKLFDNFIVYFLMFRR